MRVIAGTARGIRLRSPSTGETRPILGRAKEALFNIIAVRVGGSAVLDLFAGTGGVGIEALSRGAAAATFVERSSPIVADLRNNLERAGVAERATVHQADVFTFLDGPPAPFDVVFVGPPQWQGLWVSAMRALDERPGWVAEDGIVVVQHDPTEYEEIAWSHLVERDQRRYGGVHLVFYERR